MFGKNTFETEPIHTSLSTGIGKGQRETRFRVGHGGVISMVHAAGQVFCGTSDGFVVVCSADTNQPEIIQEKSVDAASSEGCVEGFSVFFCCTPLIEGASLRILRPSVCRGSRTRRYPVNAVLVTGDDLFCLVQNRIVCLNRGTRSELYSWEMSAKTSVSASKAVIVGKKLFIALSRTVG